MITIDISSGRQGRPKEEKLLALFSFDLFFVILILGLIVSIILRYLILKNG